MKERKAILLTAFGMAGLILMELFAPYLRADTGNEGAVRREVGSYVESRVVTLSNSETTEILPASVKRPDATCFNNSAYTIFIGSNAAGTSLRVMGFPVLSSATFRLESMTGAVYAILDTSGAGDVRCLDGKVQ